MKERQRVLSNDAKIQGGAFERPASWAVWAIEDVTAVPQSRDDQTTLRK